MNILVIGAHEDDPESGCGGLALKAVKDGHNVMFLYMTDGYRYGNVPEGASIAEVREAEAIAAAAFCGAEPYFFRYGDRELTFDASVLNRVKEFIVDSHVDVVLAHWPADRHPDHQVCGILATQAVEDLPNVGLAFYEACVGIQSFGMVADRYFDISEFIEGKKRMISFHVSQQPDLLHEYRDHVEKWYGARMGVGFAEGYYMHNSTPKIEELFLSNRHS